MIKAYKNNSKSKIHQLKLTSVKYELSFYAPVDLYIQQLSPKLGGKYSRHFKIKAALI
jgi:hypothetical protein